MCLMTPLLHLASDVAVCQRFTKNTVTVPTTFRRITSPMIPLSKGFPRTTFPGMMSRASSSSIMGLVLPLLTMHTRGGSQHTDWVVFAVPGPSSYAPVRGNLGQRFYAWKPSDHAGAAVQPRLLHQQREWDLSSLPQHDTFSPLMMTLDMSTGLRWVLHFLFTL